MVFIAAAHGDPLQRGGGGSPRRGARLARCERAGDATADGAPRACGVRPRLAAPHVRRRLGGHRVAERVRWPRRQPGRYGDFQRGTRPLSRPRSTQCPRPDDGRPDDCHPRNRGAEKALFAQNSELRGDLVPGIFGAELRIRYGLAQDTRGAQRRRVRGQRPEDLDHHRALRRLDVLPGAPAPKVARKRASRSC